MIARMSAGTPLVLLRAAPHPRDRIFDRASFARLHERFEGVEDPDEAHFDALLPPAFAIAGQPDLPAERLARATNLRALVNVEGNFFPNVDYPAAFAQGVRVLGCGPAYADAVAEMALGLAIDLARGISREDRAFRAGRERYVAENTGDSILLRGAPVGLVGFGNLGRSLDPPHRAFSRTVVRVLDPWLRDAGLSQHGMTPAPLAYVLVQSTFVYVLATVTAESERLLGPPELDPLAPGARPVLILRAPGAPRPPTGRAGVADDDALLERVAAGRFLAAVDVWPDEPLAPDHPAR